MNVARMLWIGGASLVTGWALVFLTVLDVFQASFGLAFVSFCLLLIGIVVGFYGLYASFRANRQT